MGEMRELERLAGLCFMVGYPAEGPDPELLALLEADAVGGVILFARNATSGPAMREAIGVLRARAAGWPLVALDQEGGPVLRVAEGASDLPAAMALGASDDPELAAAVGRAAGLELLAMGADMDLAPVLDVNRVEANPGIGLRSFGTRPETVIRMGGAFLRGLLASGALACGKHFPGKGAAEKDAHISMPTVDVPRDELVREDLAPFGAAVREGIPALMSSHVRYPALDPEQSATTSPAAVRLAREELGFQGLLLSDDLEMGAMTEAGAMEQHALACLASGHDLLLVCHSRELHLRLVARVVGAVEAGELPQARLEEAAGRVRAAQGRAREAPRGNLEALVEGHRGLMERAHLAGITRLGSPAPLDPARPWTLLVPRLAGLVQVEEGTGSGEVLARALGVALPRLEVRIYDPREPGVPPPVAGGPVVFASYNAHLLPAQARWLEQVAAAAGELVLVALRNPFDARLAPGARTRLLTCGYRRTAQEATARVLLGTAAPGGSFRFREDGLA